MSILLVAAFIFGYYLNDVRRDSPTKLAKPFAIASSAIVLSAVVGAFFIVGSPQSARLMQYDQQKVSDLQQIQSQVIYYWQRKQVLPNSLEDLNDPISNYKVPIIDSQTNQLYEYRISNNMDTPTFELCATFNRESKDSETYGKADINSNWYHSSGRVCFTRTIDKDLYPMDATTKGIIID